MCNKALKNGRQVFTNIDGINYQEFSNYLAIPLNKLQGGLFEVEVLESEIANFQDYTVKEYKVSAIGDDDISDCGEIYRRYFVSKKCGLLFNLTDSDIKNLPDLVLDNSFVVIDEVQDYFPAVTKKLDDKLTEFITQHRHRGIDILLLGQDEKDVHNLWRRRVDKLIHFTKLDAVGRSGSYSWQSYKQLIRGFVKLRSGTGKYESCYFPLYSSHVTNEIQTENYKDDRTNVLKSSAFTFWLPVFLLLLCFAVYYLYSFFHPKQIQPVQSAQPVQSSPPVQPAKPVQLSQPVPPAQPVQPAQPTQPVQLSPSTKPIKDISQYFAAIADKYELQLSGLVSGIKNGKREVLGYIDALDADHHLKERFTFVELVSMGWSVRVVSFGVIIKHGSVSYLVRQKPKDYFGMVPNDVRHSREISGKD